MMCIVSIIQTPSLPCKRVNYTKKPGSPTLPPNDYYTHKAFISNRTNFTICFEILVSESRRR